MQILKRRCSNSRVGIACPNLQILTTILIQAMPTITPVEYICRVGIACPNFKILTTILIQAMPTITILWMVGIAEIN